MEGICGVEFLVGMRKIAEENGENEIEKSERLSSRTSVHPCLGFPADRNPIQRFELSKKNKAVYTALFAPSRPKGESVSDGPTNQRTDGHTLI